MIESILNKLTPQQFGIHLLSYLNLYLEPIKSWKKALSNRKNSYDFTVLHLIYYTFFILIILRDIYLTIPLVLADVIILLIPFSLLFPAFRLCNKWSKIRVQSNRLFRLCLIFKFQSAPILIALFSLCRWTKSEFLYLILDNYIWIVWIGYILIYAIASRLKLIQKIAFIIISYVTVLLFFIFVVLAITKIDLEHVFDKISQISPSQEYLDFKTKTSNAYLYFDETKYLLIGNSSDSTNIVFTNTQFVNSRLNLAYAKAVSNQNKIKLLYLDSLLSSKDSLYKSKKNSIILYGKNETLTKNRLDSFRYALTKIVDRDIALTDSLKDKTQFANNKEFFSAYNFFLREYYNSYVDKGAIKSVLANAKKDELLIIDNGDFLLMYHIDSAQYESSRQKYLQLEEQLDEREEQSHFVANVFFYPLLKLDDIVEKE